MITLAEPKPRAISTRPSYRVRLATTKGDLRAAQHLRFTVFNIELGEGLATSHATERDEDAYDAYCDHLLVEDVQTGAIVGTYRLQTGALAAANLGYYSEQEFEFGPYEAIRCELVELGRACVHRDHRNLGVLGLLWQAIARYASERHMRYLIGCSSLTSQDAAVGAAVFAHLSHKGFLASPEWQTVPTAAFNCPLVEIAAASPPPPKLLRTYLSIGARICGPPAIDREFGTIDFLTLLDLQGMTPAAKSHFGL